MTKGIGSQNWRRKGCHLCTRMSDTYCSLIKVLYELFDLIIVLVFNSTSLLDTYNLLITMTISQI